MDTRQYDDEFVELLDTCKGTLLHFCMIYTDCSREEIDNLYQEMVYQLLRGYPRFRKGSQVSTWVYRTALNTALQHRRWHSRQPQTVLLDPDLCSHLADEGKYPEVVQMYELIDWLDKDEKRLITLHLSGFSFQDAADILSLPEDTVRQRVHRIIAKLKKIYEKENAQ